MGIDRQQWTARTPGPTGLRARIEQVAELVEPVELPPPPRSRRSRPIDGCTSPRPAPAPAEPLAGSGILADVPHWRTNPAAFAARLEAAVDGDADPAAVDGDVGEPGDPSADGA